MRSMAGTIACGAAVHLEDERRRPRVDLVARHAPQLLAVALVERRRRTTVAVQVVPDDDERVAVQRRRRALAELVAHALVAEVLLPEQLAVHVVGVEAERLEVGEDVLAVGDRRARRPRAVVDVRRFVRLLLARDPLPDGLSRLAIDRHDDEAMHAARLQAAARRVLRVAGDADGNRGRHEEAIAPDDRRRRSAAGNLHLPADVLAFRSTRAADWRSGDAVGVRAAPLRPVAARRRRSAPGRRGQRDDGDDGRHECGEPGVSTARVSGTRSPSGSVGGSSCHRRSVRSSRTGSV